MTQKALAQAAGLTPMTLSRLERGHNDPEPGSVERLADSLQYPVAFFFGDDIDQPTPEDASFRSLAGMSARERNAALSAGALAYLIDDWVADKFNLPEIDIPDIGFDSKPAKVARAIREHWGLGEKPVRNMVKLLEAKGVRVFSLSENTKNVDAFSCWRDGKPYVFLNTFKSAEHSRFDAAHELGHLVMHKHGGTTGQRNAEREANEFGSSFLMPSLDLESRVRHVASVAQMVDLKSRWGVSVSALAYRLHKLGRISDWRYRSFCIEISQKGFRKLEPDPMARETSVIWAKVLGVLWSEKVTKNHVAAQIGIPMDELEGLLFGLVAPFHQGIGVLNKNGAKPKLVN